MILNELIQDRNYEIIVVPFNSQGEGPASPPTTVYVGEAVPTGEPRGLEGEAVSSTEVRLKWKPPQQPLQNGELLGYKVSYPNSWLHHCSNKNFPDILSCYQFASRNGI
jgi:protein sidekick